MFLIPGMNLCCLEHGSTAQQMLASEVFPKFVQSKEVPRCSEFFTVFTRFFLVFHGEIACRAEVVLVLSGHDGGR